MKRALAIAVVVGACGRGQGGKGDASSDAAAGPTSYDAVAIARAEDLRRAADVPEAARTSHDVAARRTSARALARIADESSLPGLRARLADTDGPTVAWAAYGLGFACKGHEEENVRALAARAASVPRSPSPVRSRGTGELDERRAIARAIGRCGGPLGEAVLVGLLKTKGVWEDAAALGLGDLAVRKKELGVEAMTVLLEASARKDAPLDLALYPLSRVSPSGAFGTRIVEVAIRALDRPGDARIFAMKALGKAPREGAKDASEALVRVVTGAQSFTPAERAEAARALGALGDSGRNGAAEALRILTPDKRDAVAVKSLLGPNYHVLCTLIASLGEAPPKKAEVSLGALGAMTPPSEPDPALKRRLGELRCTAALGLARGAYDADVLEKCDARTSEASERARLTALLRRSLTGERRAAFRAFAKSDHLRVRELAIEALGRHGELGDAAIPILADALRSPHGGLVATAAQVLYAHPDRAFVLAESEKRAALDPRAGPPPAKPAQELSPAIKQALVAAINAKRPESQFETRIALVEAAASVRLPQAKRVAELACADPNPVVRERAAKALRALGESVAACDAPPSGAKPAPEIEAPLDKPARVELVTDVGTFGIVLEPELSPITATRIAALVRSGFYDGVVIHRVVPGFVVQFGDPDGDGYGGADSSLRCETSPVPFAALEVGMALAGRDTGSSQLFVTLSRTPHLDGEYTRVGHAEGAWARLAEGDVVTTARIGR